MKINSLILLIISLFGFSNIFADFGGTCSPLVNGPSDGYLANYTAYGHVKGNIDMVEYLDNPEDICNNKSLDIKFCFKMSNDPLYTGPVCGQTITIKIGDPPVKLSEISGNALISQNTNLKDLPLTVENIGNNLCLTMPTSRGQVSLGCKTMDGMMPIIPVPNIDPLPTCSNIGKSCNMLGSDKSQSIFNFSGIAVDCLKESIVKTFFDISQCTAPEEIAQNQGQALLTPFPKFQDILRQSVRALIILYIIFWASKIMLNPSIISGNEVTLTLAKAMIVIYFAVGFGASNYDPSGVNINQNGMLKHIVPLLPNITSQFANIIFSSGGTPGLCSFDNNRYKEGAEHYALFDRIDCRIAYYFGMGILSGEFSSIKTDHNIPAILNNPLSLRFFKVMSGLLFGGQVLVFFIGIIFGIIFISLILSFLSSYIISLVTIYAMIYISPIFIPMVLFKRTKPYYDSWLRIVISCLLQPAVKVGLIALLITIYDQIMYKTCKFNRIDGEQNIGELDIKYSTFKIDTDNIDPECVSSPGFKLLDFYEGKFWEKSDFLFFTFDAIKSNVSLLEDFIFMGVISYMTYFFAKAIDEFAAGITGGPDMASVTVNPGKIVDAAKQALDFGIKLAVTTARLATGDATAEKDAQDLAMQAAGKVRQGVEDNLGGEGSDKESQSESKNNDKFGGGGISDIGSSVGM